MATDVEASPSVTPRILNEPSSFAARRPNASSLPNFDLPPPPLTERKYQYLTARSPSSLYHPASVGNLLTTPADIATSTSGSFATASYGAAPHPSSSSSQNGIRPPPMPTYYSEASSDAFWEKLLYHGHYDSSYVPSTEENMYFPTSGTRAAKSSW